MSVIIQTVLEKPRVGSNLVTRTRLIDQLSQALDKRLILVLAPAGYGKTTLLTDWLNTCNLKSAWLSLDADLNDLETFVAYFIASLQTIASDIGKNVQAVLKGPSL